jgi:hypothetical protein
MGVTPAISARSLRVKKVLRIQRLLITSYPYLYFTNGLIHPVGLGKSVIITGAWTHYSREASKWIQGIVVQGEREGCFRGLVGL